MDQQVWAGLLIAFTFLHDPLYFAIYHALTHMKILRKHASIEERVDVIERRLGIKPA